MIDFVYAAYGVIVVAASANAAQLSWRKNRRRRDLQVVLDVAAHWADSRKDRQLRPEHVVGAALCDRAASIRYAGSPSGGAWMREALAGEIDRAPPTPDGPADPPLVLSASVAKAIRAAAAPGHVGASVDSLLRELLADAESPIVSLLARARAVPDATTAVPLARPIDAGPYRSPNVARLEPVIFWNDSHSPMVLVLKILREVFGLGELEAFHAMLTVHTRGSAVVGQFEEEEARRLVAAAIACARAEGAPLEITVGSPRGGRWRRLLRRS